jgi:tetratricopeptide (TPR) repeat protein
MSPKQGGTRRMDTYAQRRYTDAMPLFRRGLKSVEDGRGPNHIDTAAALYDYAVNLEGEGRYEDAEPLLRRALEIMQKLDTTPRVDGGLKLKVDEQLQANLEAQAQRQKRVPCSGRGCPG